MELLHVVALIIFALLLLVAATLDLLGTRRFAAYLRKPVKGPSSND